MAQNRSFRHPVLGPAPEWAKPAFEDQERLGAHFMNDQTFRRKQPVISERVTSAGSIGFDELDRDFPSSEETRSTWASFGGSPSLSRPSTVRPVSPEQKKAQLAALVSTPALSCSTFHSGAVKEWAKETLRPGSTMRSRRADVTHRSFALMTSPSMSLLQGPLPARHTMLLPSWEGRRSQTALIWKSIQNDIHVA